MTGGRDAGSGAAATWSTGEFNFEVQCGWGWIRCRLMNRHDCGARDFDVFIHVAIQIDVLRAAQAWSVPASRDVRSGVRQSNVNPPEEWRFGLLCCSPPLVH